MNKAIIPESTVNAIDSTVLGYKFSHVKMSESTMPYTWGMLKNEIKTPQQVVKERSSCLAVQTSGKKTSDAVIKHNSFSSCWIDIDGDDYTLEQVIKLVSNVCLSSLVVYSTASSCREKDGIINGKRWRVIIPLSSETDRHTWLDIQKALVTLCKGDKSAGRVQQILFLPNNPPLISNIAGQGQHYEYKVIEDQPLLDPQSLPAKIKAEIEREQRITKAYNAVKDIKPHAELDQSTLDGIARINEHYDLHDLLIHFGYEWNSRAYRSPNSSSGGYGLIPIDNVRWISFHTCDEMGRDAEVCKYGDTFDVLVCHKYGGDFNKALRDELNLIDPEGQKQRQRTHMENQANTSINHFDNVSSTTPLNFSDFALNSMVNAMKQQMLDDVYILGEFALLGQITNLYAGPNTGKTLTTIKLLIDAVNDGNIKGKDVFYINADDTYRGLVNKTELLNKYEINMLAPGHNGFERIHVEQIISNMVRTDTAKGKIIIIDTLKKFSDLMDKRASSNFMELLRQFASKGGSAILLAHINKHRDDEGKPIFQGTTDSVDDADCCYTIDCIENFTGTDYRGIETTRKSIMFENFKSRGDVKQKHTYNYEIIKGEPYESIINSFKSVNENDALRLKEEQRVSGLLEDNADHIECVLDGIKIGENQKTQLIERLMHQQAISKAAARKVLDNHEGDDPKAGHRWKCKKGGDKNVKIYEGITVF